MHTGMHTHDAACVGTFKGNPCRNKPRETGRTREMWEEGHVWQGLKIIWNFILC